MEEFSREEIGMINGIFSCLWSGFMNVEMFWKQIDNIGFNREAVGKVVLPYQSKDINETIKTW